MRSGAALGAIAITASLAGTAGAITRVLIEADATGSGIAGPAPSLDWTFDVLFAQRYDVVLGETCVPVDAGPGEECTEIRGEAVSMTLQPRFSTGPDGARFALLLATPANPIVETAPDDLFAELAARTAPIERSYTVEVEDPDLGTTCRDDWNFEPGGCGGSYTSDPGPWRPPEISDARWNDDDDDDGGITPWMVGPYDVVTLRPADVTALAAELDDLGYVYQQADLDAAAPYLAEGWQLVALRVSADEAGNTALTPITLTWAGTDMRLPIRLGLQASSTTARFQVYAYAAERRDLERATLRFAGRVAFAGQGFLTRGDLLVDLGDPSLTDPSVIPAPTQGEFHEENWTRNEVRVPVEEDCPDPPESDDREEGSGCCECRFGRRGHGREGNGALIVVALVLVTRRRRQSASQ